MFTVELYAKIRHAVMIDGLSRREAAKRFGVHRNTITKMLSFSVPPGYRRRERPASKKLGPYLAWIDAILEGDSQVHKKQRHTGREFSAYPVDVADFDSCKECVARIANEVGPVDILVNNAGIARDTTFKKMSKGDWDSVIRTNLDSVFNMTKQVMDGMVDRGWGRVVNVSSVNGSKGAFGQANYSAAKAGMHGFTKALTLEVARKGVTVNTIN